MGFWPRQKRRAAPSLVGLLRCKSAPANDGNAKRLEIVRQDVAVANCGTFVLTLATSEGLRVGRRNRHEPVSP